MAVGKIMKSGGVTALAAALAVVALPANAQDRGGGRWGGGGGRGGDAPAAQSNGGSGGGNWQGRGNNARPDNLNRGDRGNEGGGRNMSWRQGGTETQAPTPPAPQAQAPAQAERRNWSGNGDWQRGRADNRPDRNVTVNRGDNPARLRGDNGTNRWRNDTPSANRWRSDTAEANRWRGNTSSPAWRGDDNRWRGDRQNWAGNWNRDWRRDNRYDWRGYRNSNRNVYRLGAYYAPYRGYSYRRLNSGFVLDAMFFGSRYWINDPWQYRLPPADGPFRWVRYYDDALLVDTYTGEVVDVIYDFFW